MKEEKMVEHCGGIQPIDFYKDRFSSPVGGTLIEDESPNKKRKRKNANKPFAYVEPECYIPKAIRKKYFETDTNLDKENGEDKMKENNENKIIDEKNKSKDPIFFTITGTQYYYGHDFLDSMCEVDLIKEPDNEYDSEAIRVEVEGLGKIGYVANSTRTVVGKCMSAGRIYDKIDDVAYGIIRYVLDDCIVCELERF